MGKYIISLDQGTTSSRAIIFDKEQNIIGISQREITQIYPKEGWVEHDPMEIWATQYGALQEVISRTNINPLDICAIGITNQRETTIVWDKNTGEPVYNAIVWQCRRTADMVEALKKLEISNYIKEVTGLVPDAYFSATKIKWILDNVKEAREKAKRGDLLFGTVDTWLLWKLTKGKVHVTDYTNASRTMLYNIKELKWDERLLEKFNIPKSMLPKVKNSSEVYGYLELDNVKIKIAGIAGDQQAALFGETCFNKGDAKNTYGTGCFLLINTGEEMVKSNNGLLTTIAIGIDNKIQYALEGSVFVGGAVIQWLRDELELIEKSEEKQKSNTENEEKYRKGRMNMELEPLQKPEFYPFIESIPNVIECNCVTGNYSMLMKVAFPSTIELDGFIGQLQHFGKTQTQIVFSTPVEPRGLNVEALEEKEE